MQKLEYLKLLEAESIYILREAVAQFKRPVILFSGGKDSLVLLRLAEKALYPQKIFIPILHIDTEHNFPETLEFRDQTISRLKAKLIVRSVADSIRAGRVRETGYSRNTLQTTTLLDAIKEFGFDAAIGGARRDEEKARAKERVFSFRDDKGRWDPKNQRPELWDYYNGRCHSGEHLRVFPLSNWTELDVWQYIYSEKLDVPSLYFSHERECFQRDGVWFPYSKFVPLDQGEKVNKLTVRFRTVGDMTCSAAIPSRVRSVEEIVQETLTTRSSERSTRMDDRKSESAMEERKLDGYF